MGFGAHQSRLVATPLDHPSPILFIGKSTVSGRCEENLEVWLFYSHCQISLKAFVFWSDGWASFSFVV